jgi:UDP-2,3-diacylglucosamine hydrolase
MSHDFEIKEGAFIISDAHYSAKRPELEQLFSRIDEGILQPTQLILMGDIFDALFAPIPTTLHINKKMINLLNSIASKIEVLYLEGNHDFCLDGIFENVKIIPLAQQPLTCKFQDKTVLLAHGDFSEGLSYRFYTALIRSRFILNLLNLINTLSNNTILSKLDSYLDKKEDCNQFRGFENYIQKRLQEQFRDRCDYFFEGHFHQNRGFKVGDFNYFNLAAFACNQRYFIVQSSQKELVLGEKNL